MAKRELYFGPLNFVEAGLLQESAELSILGARLKHGHDDVELAILQ